MVPHEERFHYYVRSLEAESPVFPLPGRQFRPLSSRQLFVAEKVIHFHPERTYVWWRRRPNLSSTHRESEERHLHLMLGEIADFCPVILHNTVVKNSTFVKSIWQAIRAHYGFQATGAHFLDSASMKLDVDERPDDLFQRLMSVTAGRLNSPGLRGVPWSTPFVRIRL